MKLFAIFVAYGALLATPALAKGVSVGVYQNFPGVFKNEQGKIQGFYIDLLEATAQKENWDLQYVFGSWSQGLDRLERQEIDLLLAIAYTGERSKTFDFNKETVFVNWGQVYTGQLKITSLLDLQNKRIAGVKSDIYAHEFEELLNSFAVQHTWVELSEYQTVLQQLSQGLVDAGIVSRSNGLANEKQFEIFKSPIVCCAVEIHFATAKGKNLDLLEKIDVHLQHFKKDQTSIYYESLGHWFGDVRKPLFPEWFKWLLGVGAGLLLLFIGGTVVLKRQVRQRTSMNLRLQDEINERQRVQEAVNRLNRHNEMILNSVGEGIYGIDQAGNTTFFNPAATRMTGWSCEDIIGKNTHDLLHHSHVNGTPYPNDQCPITSSLLNGDTLEVDNEVFWRKDGQSFPVEYVSTPIYESGVVNGAVVVFRDITARWQEEAKQTRSIISQVAIRALLETGLEPLSTKKQLEVALDILLSVTWLGFLHKGSIFLMDDESGDLVMVAQRGLPDALLTLCARFKPGYCLCGRAAQSKEIVFANCLDHRHDVTFPGITEHGHYCAPIMAQNRILGVLNLYIPHGHPNNSEEDSFMATVTNTLAGLIERRKMEAQLQEVEKQLRHSAHHDALTGLPNRRYLMDMLHHSVARAKRETAQVAVMFMDLDKFKQVNDSLGHDIGDLLLKESTKRIRECLRGSDILARLGGDEFMAILPMVSSEEEVGLVADRIVKSLQIAFILNGHTCTIGSSIGIALFPAHGKDTETLVKNADLAMYTVKENGRNHFRFFEPERGSGE